MANSAPVIREGTFVPLENATRGKKKEEREQYSEWTTIQRVGKIKYIEDITRWREDMNFIFEWQNNILRTSAASE